MAQLVTRANITVNVTIQLDEDEINALDALVGYGFQPFLKVFYEHLGEAYLKPHEKGLEKLFKGIEDHVRPAHRKVHEARRLLNESLRKKQ